jgi:recombinational DNA repair protein (RecF pathway)
MYASVAFVARGTRRSRSQNGSRTTAYSSVSVQRTLIRRKRMPRRATEKNTVR